MTEVEWLTCGDADQMLELLGPDCIAAETPPLRCLVLSASTRAARDWAVGGSS